VTFRCPDCGQRKTMVTGDGGAQYAICGCPRSMERYREMLRAQGFNVASKPGRPNLRVIEGGAA
jgi:hypothetical protein